MNEPTKTKWMLAAMFAAGLVTGGAVATGVAWRFKPPHGMPTGAEIVQRVKHDLHSDLKITESQEREIVPILAKHGVQLDAIRRDTAARVLQSIEEKNAALLGTLNPEQQEKYTRIENERLKHLRERAQK